MVHNIFRSLSLASLYQETSSKSACWKKSSYTRLSQSWSWSRQQWSWQQSKTITCSLACSSCLRAPFSFSVSDCTNCRFQNFSIAILILHIWETRGLDSWSPEDLRALFVVPSSSWTRPSSCWKHYFEEIIVDKKNKIILVYIQLVFLDNVQYCCHCHVFPRFKCSYNVYIAL